MLIKNIILYLISPSKLYSFLPNNNLSNIFKSNIIKHTSNINIRGIFINNIKAMSNIILKPMRELFD